MQPETQESLSTRFAAQQEIQLTLIEKESYDLKDHLAYWKAVRLENVIAYYARKEHITKLGLQPLPTLAVTEYKAKEAINIQLLIQSLLKSEFALERWTLAETSAETINSSPRNCFKKVPFIVNVWFDNDERNSFPYTCWDFIYYQDDQNKWHKTEGLVDHNGCYYVDLNGDFVYFTLFQPDAVKYGKTGLWTVRFKNKTISASVTSSSRNTNPSSESRVGLSTSSSSESPRRRPSISENSNTESPTSSTSRLRERRRREPRESGTTDTTPRRRGTKRKLGSDSAPTPSEVGSRSTTLARHGYSRLGRLQEEARDPPLVLFTGQQNNLKCWRNRCTTKYASLFLCFSSVWKWLGPNSDGGAAKVLVAFKSDAQRQVFLNTVHIPKGTTITLGRLDSL
ncbi:regulatory protein E2 [Human papillomavirus type 48]|uniref:Regulatory protein E2 n=1 Tax=Human papillomavirus type 48 TaxID=40538 RepID=VE2_HPV48|nr:regulatory protein E2 [Human papillomavirus type 48]Q80923.1 RecName: Full=Regulatory protein E2 [Human papillomavirus type 48]AAA79467.1 regulatory protein E2 [Human papillomavirus type 48]